MRLPLIASLLLAASPVIAAEAENTTTSALPESVRKMVENAAYSGDEGRTEAVVAVAKETHPEAAGEIDAIVNRIVTERKTVEELALRQAGFFDNWSGSGEVGGSVATGNSDTVTVAVGLKLDRKGINWRHRLNALADIQRSESENTQERIGVNYQVDWNVTDRLYTLGRVGWERNQVAGLRSRFTEMVGIGYHIINLPHLKWDLEGGPALSQSRYDDYNENRLAGRAATFFLWEITPGTVFTQDASALVQEDNSSFLSVTALTSKLFGAFSARASFTVQHETRPPDLRKNTDTISRITLVYDF